MALFLRSLLLVLLARQCYSEGWFEDGQEYHYSYSAMTLSGVQEPAATGSSISINANLIIQKSGGLAVAKLADVAMAVHNGPDSLLSTLKFHKGKPELAPLEKPFKISFVKGKINGLDADSTDPDWSINIKKGLATLLQVDLVAGENFGRGDNAYIRTLEDTINGMCNTSYSFGSGDRGRQVLVKQRTPGECFNSAPRINFNTMGLTNCAGKPIPDDIIFGSSQTTYLYTRQSDSILKAHVISSLGHQNVILNVPNGAPLYNIANTTLVLKSSGPIGKAIATGSLTKLYGSLRYIVKRPIPNPDEVDLTREEDFFHPEEPFTQAAMRTKAVALLNKLRATVHSLPMEEDRAQDPTMMVVIQFLAGMSLESLRVVYSAIEKQQDLRDLYVQLLPRLGSNPSALKIKEMILQGKLSDMEATEAVTGMPFHLRLPSEKLLTSYEELLSGNANNRTKELKGSIAMAFAHLVALTCNPNRPRPCRLDNLNKYGRMAFESFRNARTHWEQMTTLLALRNTKQPNLIEKLIPLIKSGVVSHQLRPNIIYALQEIAQTHRKQFMAAIMPIFLNYTETTEIRIAAVSSLFHSKPNYAEMDQLVNAALVERNQEVRNYIVSRLRGMADSNNVCVRQLSFLTKVQAGRLAHIKMNEFGSKVKNFEFQDDTYGYGTGLSVTTVYGEESRAPLIISGRMTTRGGEYSSSLLDFFIRLEGVDEALVRNIRKIDPSDFKLEVLKEMLHHTLKIQPRVQAPLSLELTLRTRGFNVVYLHLDSMGIASLMDPKKLGQVMSQGFKVSRVHLITFGEYSAWKSNDIGIPIGFGVSTPIITRDQLAFGTPQKAKLPLSRFLSAEVDQIQQIITYMAFHFVPLGASQGIIKITGSRTHIPLGLTVGFNPVDNQVELKFNTSTAERPLAFFFGSKTVASIWGRDDAKTPAYLKESCVDCFQNALVSRGRKYLKGEILREKNNTIFGLKSQFKIYNCENYAGRSSLTRMIRNTFDPTEMNSEDSLPSFAFKSFMKLRTYLDVYPPMGTCFVKFVVHKTLENPTDAIELKLKMDTNVPTGKRAEPGKEFRNIKGILTLLGPKERKWNLEVNLEQEPSNVRSLVNVKIARQPSAALNLTARALCVSVKTDWSSLPLDIMETPSFVEPSVHRDVSLVWGDGPINDCPRANAKGVSTLSVKVLGNITEAQREAAFQRKSYPYDRCDVDRKEAGRSGAAVPLTEACYQAVMHYATPRSYIYDIQYDNMSPEGVRALNSLETITKVVLMPYATSSHSPHGATASKGHIGTSGHVEIKIDFREEDVDLHVHTEAVHNRYENVDFLKDASKLLRNSRFELDKLMALKAGWIGTCSLAPKLIDTFDNVTIPYDLPTCYTLVSADCSPSPKFAVLARKSGKTLPLAVKIFIGGHSVELIPTGSAAVEVKANDNVVKIAQGEMHIIGDLDDESTQHFVEIEKIVATTYLIRAPMLKLNFRYTGDDVTSFIPATYRAQHCGLCGDYNGQFSRELVGPSGCTVNNGTELARSYVLRDRSCKDNIPQAACIKEAPPVRSSSARFAELVRDPFVDWGFP